MPPEVCRYRALPLVLSLLAALAFLASSAPMSVANVTEAEPTGACADDSDLDALPTALERLLGTDPECDDTDADGLADGLELTLGTDPTSADDIGAIEAQGGIAIVLFPLPSQRVGVLFILHSGYDWQGLDSFRVHAGHRAVLENRTAFLMNHGLLFPSSDPRLFSMELALTPGQVGDRLALVAEFTEFGTTYSVSKAFGFFGGEFYVAEYQDWGDGYLYSFYDFSKNLAYTFAAMGGTWPMQGGEGEEGGEFLDDFIYMEKVLRIRRNGLVIDTVIDRLCDEDPGYRCPLRKNTVGEIRIGPAAH